MNKDGEKQIAYSHRYVWGVMTLFLVLFAAILYFSYIRYTVSFTNDEFNSFSVAKNLAEGKGFYADVFLDQWRSYTRAWPSTMILAGWIRVFGTSEFACKSLSAVYGLLFVISAVHITKKLFNDPLFSLASSLMMISEHMLTTYFGTVRMYSLEVLLSLWMYYFIYMGLSRSNPYKKNLPAGESKRLRHIASDVLDYHWGYIFAGFLLLIINRYNMVNSLIPLGGICIYIAIKAVTTKEKKFVFASFVMLFGAGLVLLNFLAYFVFGRFPVMGDLFGSLSYHFKPGLRSEYFSYIFGAGLFGRWYIAIPVLGFIILTCFVKKELDDVIVFDLCISTFTISFLAFFTHKHGFSARYILMLVPWTVMIFAYSVICAKKWNKKLLDIGVICLILIEIAYGVRYMYLFNFTENSLNTDFMTAYGKIDEYYDVENESFPVAYYMLRKYYYTKIVPEDMIGEHRSLKKSAMTDDFIDFAADNPEGILTVERIKVQYTSQDLADILMKWTDRISGEGVDNTGVNVSHYCFLEPTDTLDRIDGGASLSDGEISIVISRDMLERIYASDDNAEVLFVTLDIEMENGTTEERRFGLLMGDEDLSGEGIRYVINADTMRKIDSGHIVNVVLEPMGATYSDGILKDDLIIY